MILMVFIEKSRQLHENYLSSSLTGHRTLPWKYTAIFFLKDRNKRKINIRKFGLK